MNKKSQKGKFHYTQLLFYIFNSPKAFGEFIGSLSQFWGQLFPLLDTEFPLFFSLVFSILSFSKFYSPLNLWLLAQLVLAWPSLAQLGPARPSSAQLGPARPSSAQLGPAFTTCFSLFTLFFLFSFLSFLSLLVPACPSL